MQCSLRNHFYQLVVEKTCNYHDNQLQKSRRVSAKTLNGIRGSTSVTPKPSERSIQYAESDDDAYGPNAWFIDRHESTSTLMKPEYSPAPRDMSPRLSSTNGGIKAEQHYASKQSPHSTGANSAQTNSPEEDSRSHSPQHSDYEPESDDLDQRKRRHSDFAEAGAERVAASSKRARTDVTQDEHDALSEVELRFRKY